MDFSELPQAVGVQVAAQRRFLGKERPIQEISHGNIAFRETDFKKKSRLRRANELRFLLSLANLR